MYILPIGVIGRTSEADQQAALVSLLESIETDWDGYRKYRVYKEVTIPGLGRRSDIVLQTPLRLINIECKLSHYHQVFDQAYDHFQWADYSCICLHASALVPNWFLQKIMKYGIGLILWTGSDFIEVNQPYRNFKKNGLMNEKLRSHVEIVLKQAGSIKTAENHKQLEFLININKTRP